MRKYLLSALIILLSGCSSGLSVEGVLPKLESKQAKVAELEISDQEIGLYPFRDDDTDLWGFLDAQGNIAIEAKFSELKYFTQGVAAVNYEGQWGFINYLGQFVVEPKYLKVADFSDNKTAPVGTYEQSYYIDRRGKKAIVPKQDYAGILPYSEGLAGVQSHNNKWGFIDEEGNEVIKTKFDLVTPFSDGLALVRIGYKYTYIDKSGKLVFPVESSYGTKFKDGRALADGDDGHKILASNGEVVKILNKMNPDPRCDSQKGYSEGLLGIRFLPLGVTESLTSRLRMKCGFVDRDGNVVIEAKFDEVGQFIDGLAGVKIGSKHGYIDKNGNVVIEAKFDKVSNFHKGLATVSEPPLVPYGYINQQGEYVWKSVEF